MAKNNRGFSTSRLEDEQQDATQGRPAASTPPVADEPKNIPFEELPSDHPIHQLARFIWEGDEKFDAFHAIRPDGKHIFVDINRFVGVDKVTGRSVRDQLEPTPKLQTGNISQMPEVGRMASWCARAVGYQEMKIRAGLPMNDGTHATFIKAMLIYRVQAALAACNSEQQAGFSGKVQQGEEEIKLPFAIEQYRLDGLYVDKIKPSEEVDPTE